MRGVEGGEESEGRGRGREDGGEDEEGDERP